MDSFYIPIIDTNKKDQRSVAIYLNKYRFQTELMQKINGPSFNSIQITVGVHRENPNLWTSRINLFKFQSGKPGLNPDLPHGFSCYMHMHTYYLKA